MAWLIGIICVILVIVFWRIFLPLGIIAAVGIAAIFLVMQHNENKRAQEKQIAALELKQKIAKARANATPEGKKWVIFYVKGPASLQKIGRIASVISNDSLCTLSVEKRLNGTQLTGLDCRDIRISKYEDIEIKFSSAQTSVRMDLRSYSNSDYVYIPSYQDGRFSYENFITGLKNGKAVAIKLPAAGGIWTTFSLEGSTEALNQLGKANAELK